MLSSVRYPKRCKIAVFVQNSHFLDSVEYVYCKMSVSVPNIYVHARNVRFTSYIMNDPVCEIFEAKAGRLFLEREEKKAPKFF